MGYDGLIRSACDGADCDSAISSELSSASELGDWMREHWFCALRKPAGVDDSVLNW